MEDAKIEYTEVMLCGHCGNKTRMEIVTTYTKTNMYEPHPYGSYENGGPDIPYETFSKWSLALCPVCSKMTLTSFFTSDFHEYPETEILYPTTEEHIEGLPPEIDKSYRAALSVRNIDSNAFGVLMRRLLEKICIDRAASGRNLVSKLDSLAEKGEIPERLATMADQVRMLGNIGAHADAGELTPVEVPVLEALCKALLEYIYTAPKLIDQVSAQIDVLKRRNSE